MRTKGARDTAKRKPRRQMTVAEKVVQQRKSNATKEKTKKQQKEEAERARPARDREFFSRRSTKQPATTGEEMSDDNSNNNDTINCNDIGGGRATVEVQNEDVWHDDDDEQRNASQQHDGPIQSEDEVITIDSNITPKGVTPKEVVATLDCEEDDEDGRDEYDVDEEDDGNITNNVNGYYSDPPGVQWYTKRLKKDGVVATNKYGMDLLDCSRGTNRVESFHKDLITDWGSWNLGMEMSVKLLREKRHRHNQQVSEKRRDGYPKIGHCDTWEVDELQSLVLKTRGYLLFPNWSNSSEYVTTEESFDVVALQSKDVQEALEARCQELEERGALPKLTRELQFQCKAMGTPLPLLPFSNDEERMQFSTYVHELKSPVSTIDDRKAAADWNRSYVDGINI